MKYITKLKLAAVHQLCEAQDKSTEYTIQYMQDVCKVDLDTVIIYFGLCSGEKAKLFKEVNALVKILVTLNE